MDSGPLNLAAAATRLAGARLVIAAVYSGGAVLDGLAGEYAGELSEVSHEELEQVRTKLRAQGIDAEVLVVERSSPARGIAAAIEEIEPGLVVVGSTRRGAIGRVLLGSTAERVIQGAPCPVAVAPHGFEVPDEGLRTIGAAFTASPEGREALRAAALLARAKGAHVRAIMVLDPRLAEVQSPRDDGAPHRDRDPGEDAAGRHVVAAEESLRDAIGELAPGVDVAPDVLFRDPADGLVAASEQLDLLVMGSRAYGPARAVMLGGVSRQVVVRGVPRPRAASRHRRRDRCAARGRRRQGSEHRPLNRAPRRLERTSSAPATVDEDLSTKPSVLKQLVRMPAKSLGALTAPASVCSGGAPARRSAGSTADLGWTRTA